MFFDSIPALIEMDGHGVYVWAAYGVSVVLLKGLFFATYLKQRHLKNQLK